MSHLGNIFANTYDKEERKNTGSEGSNKVPYSDWRDFDKN